MLYMTSFNNLMVCILQLIGWREVSRKLLLFITDAGFHYAGDGKVCFFFVFLFLCVYARARVCKVVVEVSFYWTGKIGGASPPHSPQFRNQNLSPGLHHLRVKGNKKHTIVCSFICSFICLFTPPLIPPSLPSFLPSFLPFLTPRLVLVSGFIYIYIYIFVIYLPTHCTFSYNA